MATVPKEIAIDVGTSTLRVAIRGKGLVLEEPTVVAVDTRSREVLALGRDAAELVGRTAEHVVAVRPLRQGAITDFDMAARMLHHVLVSCGVSRLSRAKVLLTVPSASTSIERRALQQAARAAGAAHAVLLEATMAAAIGLDLPINEPVGSVIVDLGAGTTETGVISLGGVVAAKALRLGGLDLNGAIQSAVRHEHDLVVGDEVAEDLKIRLGSAGRRTSEIMAEVHGRRPRTAERAIETISSTLVDAAIADHVTALVAGTSACLAEAPPELAQDAIFEGLHLVGGGSLLDGFAGLLSEKTSVPVRVASNPARVVIEGAARCLEDLNRLRPLFVSADR